MLPQLSDLFTSSAPCTLPKTTAPLCGYHRGLHPPNSGCKSSLKRFFLFLQETWACSCLCLWQHIEQPSSCFTLDELREASQSDVQTGPTCNHSPTLTPQLHKAPARVAWPKLAKMPSQAGAWLMPDEGVFTAPPSTLLRR